MAAGFFIFCIIARHKYEDFLRVNKSILIRNNRECEMANFNTNHTLFENTS